MNCRFCETPLQVEFIDLGNAPPSNAFLTKDQLDEPEVFYPLKLWICEKCLLVQLEEYKRHEKIFNKEYVYFSSYSSSWLEHAKTYVDMITIKLGLDQHSQVIEIASNDGYLLQYFQAKKISCLGIEPSSNTAQVCKAKGIAVIEDFFGARLAATLPQADLIVGNNVLAHVPDLHDFVKGLKITLKAGGTLTMEFPHLLRLIEHCQFDTIYHEHFSYLSLLTTRQIFSAHELEIYNCEELPTHGGSLRIYATHQNKRHHPISPNVKRLLQTEQDYDLHTITGYQHIQRKVDRIKEAFLTFLLDAKRDLKKVVGYGAAAKGNTLLNYCGVKKDLLAFVADKSPHKQGSFLPGNHIPVVSPEEIVCLKPDYVIIFPWNIQDEILHDLAYITQWGGKFVVAVPHLKIFDVC